MRSERLDWWEIDNEVGRRLITGERNLVEWAAELAAAEPQTSRDAVVKLDVCMRAALDDEACAAVCALWLLGPGKADNYMLTSSYYAATDQHSGTISAVSTRKSKPACLPPSSTAFPAGSGTP